MFKVLVLFFVFVCSVNAQRLVSGTCPTIATDNEFDVGKFFGKWILTETTPSLFDFILKCMEMDYENQKDGTLAINVKGLSL